MKLGQRIFNHIAPPAFDLQPKELRLIQHMYPNIDWQQVRFYHQMPWYMHYSFAIGTALPRAYERASVQVYFRNRFECSVQQRLCLLVHEAFHVQQYYELNSLGKKNRGWGFFRRFMRYYIGGYLQMLWQKFIKERHSWAIALQLAYREHPMEKPAYDQEAAFRNYIPLYRGHSVRVLFKKAPQLVYQETTPLEAPSLPFHILGACITLLITILTPLLELPLLLLAYLLGGRPNPQQPAPDSF